VFFTPPFLVFSIAGRAGEEHLREHQAMESVLSFPYTLRAMEDIAHPIRNPNNTPPITSEG
jgi:hypothetical protein